MWLYSAGRQTVDQSYNFAGLDGVKYGATSM